MENKNKILNNYLIFYLKFLTALACFTILLNNYNIQFSISEYNAYNNDLKKVELKSLENVTIYITSINYSFSYLFHKAKIEYNFIFYDSCNQAIEPSDLTLYYHLHIFCHTIEINNNMTIKSIANVKKNKYYNCIEFFNLNEKMNFGITIYKRDKFFDYFKINFLSQNLINYNNIFLKYNYLFDPLIILNNNFKLNKLINGNTNNFNLKNKTLLIKKSYFIMPIFFVKSSFAEIKEKWFYKNIYNNYFCFCKFSEIGKCTYKTIPKKCKYNIYLNIINNEKNLYKKTDYLLADFSSPDTAPCEAYLLFQKMIELNINAHYMTQREDIYKRYKKSKYSYNIPIIYGSTFIDGEFLEKYLKIFLKLKATISGAKIFSIDNLFYNIDYITYICLGHGISYLKDFLYIDYYSCKIYNKIILPYSKKIISNAMKFGWKYNDIIKFGLPRWDILVKKENIFKIDNIQNNSIFIMFTWRELKNNKKISKYYFINILNLINNKILGEILQSNNITLYFSLHHNIEEYKYIFKKNRYIKYIKQEGIIECLKKTNLVITDFSSIIFDIMVRNKPYIIFIPDSEDHELIKIYNSSYYDVINSLNNRTIYFENIFFNINETIDKMIYYIKSNFQLDENLKLFYKSFNLKGGINTINIINR